MPGLSSIFRAFTDPVRGRGLIAARAIYPGEEVLREKPAALVLGGDDSSEFEEIHEMVAQMLLCSRTAELKESIAQLCSFVKLQRERDPSLLAEVARHATPAVRALVKARAGAAAAKTVDSEVVVLMYCKHLLNSMIVLDPETLETIGTALYPRDGALLNHDNKPNCWTLFEPVAVSGGDCLRGGGKGGGCIYELVVRSLTAIKEGDELTIACEPHQAASLAFGGSARSLSCSRLGWPSDVHVVAPRWPSGGRPIAISPPYEAPLVAVRSYLLATLLWRPRRTTNECARAERAAARRGLPPQTAAWPSAPRGQGTPLHS